MTMMWWAVCAACSAGCAAWTAMGRTHGRLPDGRSPESEWGNPSVTVVMGMLTAVIRQGAAIPTALEDVGCAVGGGLGEGLREVADGLRRGLPWHEVWMASCGDGCRYGNHCRAIRDALEDAWLHGASPVERLTVAIDREDVAARADIERRSARLSVRLLMPTGLCFLPAFICIGVIPAVMSML